MCLEIKTVEYGAEALHISSNTGLLHLIDVLHNRLDLQHNNLICFKIFAPSQLLRVEVEPKYFIESAYAIGKTMTMTMTMKIIYLT